MEINSINPKVTQKQVTNKLGNSDSTLKRYRNDKKMKCPLDPLTSEMDPKELKNLKKTNCRLCESRWFH